MKMIKTASTQFSCPGCERNNFRSLRGVRNHFIKKGHSFRCPVCQRAFQDELGIIQHYQKYSKSTSPGAPSDNHQIPPTSAPSSSAVVTPVMWSKVVHNSASEESFKSSQQVSEIPGIQFPHGLLASVPFTSVDKCPSLGKDLRIHPLTKPRVNLLCRKLLQALYLQLGSIPRYYLLWSKISSCDISGQGAIHGIVFRQKDIS